MCSNHQKVSVVQGIARRNSIQECKNLQVQFGKVLFFHIWPLMTIFLTSSVVAGFGWRIVFILTTWCVPCSGVGIKVNFEPIKENYLAPVNHSMGTCLTFTGSPGCTPPPPACGSHPPIQPAGESLHGTWQYFPSALGGGGRKNVRLAYVFK